MTRKECLEQAMGCVLRDRQKQYGEPEDCFETIAMMWSAYLGKIIQGWDVAAMMALLKIARIKANPAHADNWCDLAGYAACGAECRQKFEAETKKTVEDAFETFPHLKPEVEGCCCQNGKVHAIPEFKHGDAVEWNSIGKSWCPAVYEREFGDFGHCVVRLPDGRERIVSKVDLRRPEANHPENPDSSNRAEGCEALVEKDAPQTKEELFNRIVDCNPSTFGCVHKPTGEELAEMAEEEVHAGS